jgi:hypothetical protein
MPLSDLSESFLNSLDVLAIVALNNASVITNVGIRQWFLGDLDAWSGDPLDIDAIGQAFDRSEAGAFYTEVLTGPEGSAGDTASCKIQSDYLALQERAFRLRHMTPIRCRLAAASRLSGQGDRNLGAFGNVGGYSQDLLVAGATNYTPRG